MGELRSLVLVLGDQLYHESAAFDGFEPQLDAVCASNASAIAC